MVLENGQPDPNPGVNQGGAAPAGTPAGSAAPAAPAQPSVYDSLKAKKGFKSDDAVATSYEEIEASYHRTKNVVDTVKQQLEAQGFTVDEKGNVIQAAGAGLPAGEQPLPEAAAQPVAQPGAGAGQEVYDPYTGQVITNPQTLQIINTIPDPVQRQMAITNLVIQQNEQFQTQAVTSADEVLSKPEAKGFETDVRKVMLKVPLAQRADKKNWEDALLRVKGVKYDEALKNAGAQGVEAFVNKETIQTIPGAAGAGGAPTNLTAEQEQNYQWYQQNKPGMFKDRAHFASRL